MIKIISTLILGLVVLAVAMQTARPRLQLEKRQVRIGEATLMVEVADTPLQRARGLARRAGLSDNEGMLFVFDTPGYHKFWMKGMKFPIDIVWLNENLQIVDISPNLAPSSYPTVFAPQKPAKYVLEVRAGWAVDYGVGVGQAAVI